MKRSAVWVGSVVLMGLFSGCAVKYGCPAPEGVTCKSISEVYAKSRGQGKAAGDRGKTEPVKESILPAPDPRLRAPDSAVPLRSVPKVLRVWIAPWIDEEGDLHQEGHLYMVVDSGEWVIGAPSVGPEPKTGELIRPHRNETRPSGGTDEK